MPRDTPLTLEEGPGGKVIRHRVFVHAGNGRPQFDPEVPDQVWTRQVVSPCTRLPLTLPAPGPRPEVDGSGRPAVG